MDSTTPTKPNIYQPGIVTTDEFLSRELVPYTWLSPYEVTNLEQRKKLWKSAMEEAGASPGETAIVLAQLMQETESGAGYDHLKDQATDGSRNFSNLNLNHGMLKNYGKLDEIYQGELTKLNDDENIGIIVQSLLFVMRQKGTDRYLYFVRGGRQGYNYARTDHVRFALSIRKVANYLLEHPEYISNNMRVAHDIKWI